MSQAPDLPSVSLIVAVHNECKYLECCLESLARQDYPVNRLEVLVVDSHSDDDSRDIVQRFAASHPNVSLLDNPRRIIPVAWNLGVKNATGDIIALVNAHSTLAPDYVWQCVKSLEATDADGVGGIMIARGDSYVGQATALAMTTPFGAGDAKYRYTQQGAYVDTIPLAVYRREVFERVGLFDETLVRNEDYELNYRIRLLGGRLFLSPDIRFYYTPRASIGRLWRQYFQYGRWKVRTLQKYPESLRWRQAAAPLFVSTLFGSLLLGLLWPPARWALASLVGCYLLANLVASTIAARRGGWRYLPILPIVFATIHFAWGLGFWVGLMLVPFTSRR